MSNFGLSMLWYWCGYIIVTIIGILHTIFNWKVFKMGVMNKNTKRMKDIESYAKTMPFHPLYNIIIFPIFAFIYLNQIQAANIWQEAFLTGAIWLGVTAIVDLIGWVLIPHPWKCTFKDFYVDYQPWISLIYIAIFISPLISALLL